MKNPTFWLLFFGLFFLHSCNEKEGLQLSIKGKSDYKIVIPKRADAIETKAAVELQRYLLKISGSQLQIVDGLSESSEKEILVGRCDRSETLNFKGILDALDEDGFLIKMFGIFEILL